MSASADKWGKAYTSGDTLAFVGVGAYNAPQQHPPRLSTMRTRRVSRLRALKTGVAE